MSGATTTMLLNSTLKVANSTLKVVATTTLKPSRIKDIPSTFQIWFTLCVIVIVLVVLAINKGPPQHVMFMAVLTLWNVDVVYHYPGKKILDVTQALASFGNSSMITVGGLFVVIVAIERARVVNLACGLCSWREQQSILGQYETPDVYVRPFGLHEQHPTDCASRTHCLRLVPQPRFSFLEVLVAYELCEHRRRIACDDWHEHESCSLI